jgi:hypothetical protein
MKKLEKIEREMERTRERITEWQSKLKELDGQRTEQENLEIVSAVRALGLTREELLSFVSGGALPETIQGEAAMPAARYSRGKTESKRTAPGITDGATPFSDSESEAKPNEE